MFNEPPFSDACWSSHNNGTTGFSNHSSDFSNFLFTAHKNCLWCFERRFFFGFFGWNCSGFGRARFQDRQCGEKILGPIFQAFQLEESDGHGHHKRIECARSDKDLGFIGTTFDEFTQFSERAAVGRSIGFYQNQHTTRLA